MSGLLKAAQHHQAHQVSDMQAVGSGVEAGIDRSPLGVEPVGQIHLVSALMHQTSPAELSDNIFQFSCPCYIRSVEHVEREIWKNVSFFDGIHQLDKFEYRTGSVAPA